MGFLDKLLNKGAQALGDVVSDKLSEVVHGDNEIGDAVRSVTSAVAMTPGEEERRNRITVLLMTSLLRWLRKPVIMRSGAGLPFVSWNRSSVRISMCMAVPTVIVSRMIFPMAFIRMEDGFCSFVCGMIMCSITMLPTGRFGLTVTIIR